MASPRRSTNDGPMSGEDLKPTEEPGSTTNQPGTEPDQNARLHTTEEAIRYANSFPRQERYAVQKGLVEQLLRLRRNRADAVEQMHDYMMAEGSYRDAPTGSAFPTALELAQRVIQQDKRRRNGEAEAKKRITQHWCDGPGLAWVEAVASTEIEVFLNALAKLASSFRFEEAVLRLNSAMISRLRKNHRGFDNMRRLQAGDIDLARAMSTSPDPVSEAVLHEMSLHIGTHGILEDDAPDVDPLSFSAFL